MYAVVETGGKQYRVQEGDVLRVEKLAPGADGTVEFDRVLMVTADDGDVRVGTPYVPDAKVIARVVSEGKSRKLLVFTYKAKKNYRRRYGHRQPFTEVRVQTIQTEAPVAEAGAPEAGADVPANPSDGGEV
ncbi:MAG: 50S ribosomal protein L21 [Bacillota bacterium]